MTVFAEDLQQRFLQAAIQHVNQCFPEDAAELGPSGIESLVGEAVASAQRYGCITGAEILRYLNVAVMLGGGFDRDTEYPWAAEALQNTNLSREEKLERLEAAVDRLFEE